MEVFSINRKQLPLVTIFVVLLGITLSLSSGADEPAPAELLYNPDQAWSHTLSPNGNLLAYLTRSGSSVLLQLVDIQKMAVIDTFNLGTNSITELHWFNNHRLIYNSGGRIKAVNTKGTENIVLVDYLYGSATYSSWRELLKNLRGWSIVSMLPNDPENILLSGNDLKGYTSLSKINIYTGKKIDIASGPKHKIHNWFIDQQGNVRLALRQKKGEQQLFVVKGDDTNTLALQEMKVGDYKLDYDGKSYIDQRIFFSAFSYAGDSVFLSENTDRDKFRLVEYSLKEDKTLRIVAENNDFDIVHSFDDPSSRYNLIFDHDAQRLVGVRYQADKTVTIWFDDELKNLQKILDDFHPKTINLILDWTKNRSHFVIKSFSDQVPGETSIYIKDSNKLAVVSDNRELYKKTELATTKFVYFTARDGNKIPAYLTKALNSEFERPPLVVIPHGGPWARDRFGYDPDVQFFATRGYTVLQPQFRGSSGFGRAFMLAGKQDLMGIMLNDIADGAKWLANTNQVDEDRIFIMGASYGGYAALMSAVNYGSLYKAAVAFAAPTNIVDQIKYYKKEKFYFGYEYWKVLVGDPKASKQKLLAISPISHINEMHIPILVAAGDKDEIVSFEQFEDFEAKVRKIDKKNIITQKFKNEGHGFKNPSNQIYYMEQALALFEKQK